MANGDALSRVRTMEELVALATELAEADERMLYALIRARKDAGLSQRDLAEALGIKQSSVAAFERYDNDPRLSTIRRYAVAVGALVDHRVACGAWGGEWTPMRGDRRALVTFGADEADRQFAYAAPTDTSRTDLALAA